MGTEGHGADVIAVQDGGQPGRQAGDGVHAAEVMNLNQSEKGRSRAYECHQRQQPEDPIMAGPNSI